MWISVLAYLFSLSGLGAVITALLLKGRDMRLILLLTFFGNLLVGISYLLNGTGLNGAAACFVGGAQSLINYAFESKSRPLPACLKAIHAVAMLGVNWIVADGFSIPLCLAMGASICFVGSILQHNGAAYRTWCLLNTAFWSAYDLMTRSYQGLITHGILLTVTVVGMLLHDRPGRKSADPIDPAPAAAAEQEESRP